MLPHHPVRPPPSLSADEDPCMVSAVELPEQVAALPSACSRAGKANDAAGSVGPPIVDRKADPIVFTRAVCVANGADRSYVACEDGTRLCVVAPDRAADTDEGDASFACALVHDVVIYESCEQWESYEWDVPMLASRYDGSVRTTRAPPRAHVWQRIVDMQCSPGGLLVVLDENSVLVCCMRSASEGYVFSTLHLDRATHHLPACSLAVDLTRGPLERMWVAASNAVLEIAPRTRDVQLRVHKLPAVVTQVRHLASGVVLECSHYTGRMHSLWSLQPSAAGDNHTLHRIAVYRSTAPLLTHGTVAWRLLPTESIGYCVNPWEQSSVLTVSRPCRNGRCPVSVGPIHRIYAVLQPDGTLHERRMQPLVRHYVAPCVVSTLHRRGQRRPASAPAQEPMQAMWALAEAGDDECDTTLVWNNTTSLSAHWAVLRAACPYFEAAHRSGMLDVRRDSVGKRTIALEGPQSCEGFVRFVRLLYIRHLLPGELHPREPSGEPSGEPETKTAEMGRDCRAVELLQLMDRFLVTWVDVYTTCLLEVVTHAGATGPIDAMAAFLRHRTHTEDDALQRIHGYMERAIRHAFAVHKLEWLAEFKSRKHHHHDSETTWNALLELV